jgi:thioester reductase-like protein
MENLIKEYSSFEAVPSSSKETLNTHKDGTSNQLGSSVILTGTTGSLGSYLLLTLLKTSGVQQIYCLNRSKTARDQFVTFLKSLSLSNDVDNITQGQAADSRVSFFYTPSLGLPDLGLEDRSQYEHLLQANITQIIHNAWPVNFNLSLSSYTSHLAGVRALIEFCCQHNTSSVRFS